MTDSLRYVVLAEECRVEDVIQRSRFLSAVTPAASVEEAHKFVARIRDEFPDATHHCHAFLVGPPGSTARVGMSDDGEPHGTAGRPMLDVLVHGGVGDVAAVVTRWFGGTKLGKGGLVRAYGGGVQRALEQARTTERARWTERTVEAEYALAEGLRRLLGDYEAELLDERFGASVRWRLRVPEDRLEALAAAVRDATGGRVALRPPEG